MPATTTPPNATLCTADVLSMIEDRGAVPNIGQITGAVKRDLDKLVRRGALAKYRGHWNTGHAAFGMGPLKTIYATPEVGALAASLCVAG